MQEWTEEVLESNKSLFLCFLYIYYMIGPENSSYNLEFEFVDIFYSKFQLVLTFSFAVNFVLKIGFFVVT